MYAALHVRSSEQGRLAARIAFCDDMSVCELGCLLCQRIDLQHIQYIADSINSLVISTERSNEPLQYHCLLCVAAPAQAAAVHAETAELREYVVRSGDDCSRAYVALLEHVHDIVVKPTYEKKQKLLVLSREVANTVSDLVSSAEALKGSNWINPEDPTVIAENELMKAAASIELAAKKLEELQPRREIVGVA